MTEVMGSARLGLSVYRQSTESMKVNWNYPTAVRTGEGRAAEIADICKEWSISAPLVVTDPGIAALPMTEKILATARDAGLNAALFCDVKPNPTGGNVAAGIQAFREGNHDGIIALGGGSGLDAGKAVAVAANQTCSLWDLEDVGDNWLNADADKIPPIIAIPTTAGTGSEVGRASVIVKDDEERKLIIFHPKMLPDCVILDPELTTGLPAGLTAATEWTPCPITWRLFARRSFTPWQRGLPWKASG